MDQIATKYFQQRLFGKMQTTNAKSKMSTLFCYCRNFAVKKYLYSINEHYLTRLTPTRALSGTCWRTNSPL